MRFDDPYWLAGGVLACLVLVGTWYRHDLWQRSALEQFVARHLRHRLTGSVSWMRRLLQRALFLSSVLCLCGALAGPLLGFHFRDATRRGDEVVFAIDTSRSMLTQDVKPDRLTRAKLAIDDMASKLDGDAIGLVAFAGSAFVVCPPTFDHGAFQQYLEAVDTRTTPKGGTDISSAIRVADRALSNAPANDRILILVTDGENLEGNALAAAKSAARQDGLKIFTVGVGTTNGGLIPLPAEDGGGYVKDEKGDLVRSRLGETLLEAIATATSAAYIHVGDQGADFDAFLRHAFTAVSKHDMILRQGKVYDERYQWPLAAAMMLLLASLIVGTRRAIRRPMSAAALTVVLSASCFIIVPLVIPRRAESADHGVDSSRAGIESPVVDYNAGTRAYRGGHFLQAARLFQQSIRSAPASDATRVTDQEDAYYDLGNALYRSGQRLEQSDFPQAMQKWKEAVRAYDTALQLRSDDADSKYNRDFVERQIIAFTRLKLDDRGLGKGHHENGGKGQGKTTSSSQRQPPPPGPSQQQGVPRPQPSTPSDQRSGRHASRQMTLEEARELLDSDEPEKHLALTILPGRRASSRNPAVRDW